MYPRIWQHRERAQEVWQWWSWSWVTYSTVIFSWRFHGWTIILHNLMSFSWVIDHFHICCHLLIIFVYHFYIDSNYFNLSERVTLSVPLCIRLNCSDNWIAHCRLWMKATHPKSELVGQSHINAIRHKIVHITSNCLQPDPLLLAQDTPLNIDCYASLACSTPKLRSLSLSCTYR